MAGYIGNRAVALSTTAANVTGTVTAGALDISGDTDVDGTTNLDVVDIDGAVDMASTLAVGGVVTANAGVVVDNITIDSNELDISTNFTIDASGYIIIDSDDGNIYLNDNTVGFGQISGASGDLTIKSSTADKDIIFQGNDSDGGGIFTALTIDMSEAGAATFNAGVTLGGVGTIDLADGVADNAYALTVKNREATDDRSYGLLIHAGSTTVDRALTINDHDGNTALFYVAGNGNTGVNMAPDSAVKLTVNGAVGPTNGSAGSPTHTFYGDPDTGMFRAAANTLGFSTGGTESMRIDSSGNIIAKTGEVQVSPASGTAKLRLTSQGSGSEVFTLCGQIPGISNTGFSIRNETDSRNDLVIDGSGSVGIGTSSPSYKFVVSDGGNFGFEFGPNDGGLNRIYSYDRGTSAYKDFKLSASQIIFGYGSSGVNEAMRIDSSGRVGIGVTPAGVASDTAVLQAGGTFLVHFDVDDGGTTALGNNIYWDGSNNRALFADPTSSYHLTSGQHRFYTGPSVSAGAVASNNEAMRIDNSGNVIFGSTGSTSAPTMYFAPDSGGGAFISKKDSTNSRRAFEFNNPNGTVGSIDLSGSTTTYAISSDYRLKENVVYDWDATTRLKQLKPAQFNFIVDKDKTVDGFLAHEVQSIVPEAITGTKDEVDDDGNAVMQGIDQSKLVPLLVKTIQELEARIAALEAG